MVKASLNAWASSMGIDQQTLERKLVKSGYNPPKKKGGVIPFKKIYVAIMGDEQMAKIRNLEADAKRKEREEDEAAGMLFPMEKLESQITQLFIIPLSNILASAATTLDTRCNPQHPEVARKAIEDWLENTVKPQLKTKLQQAQKL